MGKIILVAGTPASGKTSFGDYLRDKKHYLHVDIEEFDGSYLHSIWLAAVKLKEMSLFLNTLNERSHNTILTWGFHLDDLQIVADLKRAGVKLWWFEADEASVCASSQMPRSMSAGEAVTNDRRSVLARG